MEKQDKVINKPLCQFIIRTRKPREATKKDQLEANALLLGLLDFSVDRGSWAKDGFYNLGTLSMSSHNNLIDSSEFLKLFKSVSA